MNSISTSGPIPVLLLGGGQLLFDFAVRLNEGSRDTLVVTSPRHAEETVGAAGGRMSLATALEAAGIRWIEAPRLSEVPEVEEFLTPRALGVSISGAWIYRAPFIERFGGRLVNLHAQRLPLNRGAGGFSWMIMRGDRRGGVTLHLVDEGVDTGAIVAQRSFTYPASCRVPNDYSRFAGAVALELLAEFVARMDSGGTIEQTPQVEHLGSYLPRLNTHLNGLIDWKWSLDEIERFVLAFDDPYQGASTFLRGQRVLVKSALADMSEGGFHPFQTGIVYRVLDGALYMAHRDGALVVADIRDEAGQDVSGAVRVGDRLTTPAGALDEALAYRATYTPTGLKGTT